MAKPYQVVVQFLSTGLRNCLKKSFTVIESKNEMLARTIIGAKWLRNPDNWNPNQMKAHAVFSLNSANTANNVMKSGILINGT